MPVRMPQSISRVNGWGTATSPPCSRIDSAVCRGERPDRTGSCRNSPMRWPSVVGDLLADDDPEAGVPGDVCQNLGTLEGIVVGDGNAMYPLFGRSIDQALQGAVAVGRVIGMHVEDCLDELHFRPLVRSSGTAGWGCPTRYPLIRSVRGGNQAARPIPADSRPISPLAYEAGASDDARQAYECRPTITKFTASQLKSMTPNPIKDRIAVQNALSRTFRRTCTRIR